MTRLLFSVLAAGLIPLTAVTASANTYRIDADHSHIMMNATHLGIGTVQGRFDRFSGTFEYNPADVTASNVSLIIDASSINTNQATRDAHLRSADFLNVKVHHQITFESTRVTRYDQDRYEIQGDLSLHGVTRSVTMLATLGGTIIDDDGAKRIAFDSTLSIHRKDFGLNYNRIVGVGTKLVGEVIEIVLNVEGVEASPGSD